MNYKSKTSFNKQIGFVAASSKFFIPFFHNFVPVLIGLIVPHFGSSQSTLTLSGTCLNSGNRPVQDATVKLYSQDSVLVHAVLSDSLGNFRFENIERKQYFLSANHFMEGSSLINIDLNQANSPLSYPLILKENKIDEVVVNQKKPVFEKKIDRFVFNVENSISSNASNALEVLSKTPGVLVSNNDISIIGKSSIEVLIDDRNLQLKGQDLLNYLQSIPGDNISKIEVITNPPARYSASGNSGLINICLKKSRKKGYNGSLTGNFQQATYSMFGGVLSFNYKKNRFSFMSSISYDSRTIHQSITNSTNYTSQQWQVETVNKFSSQAISGSFNLLFETKSNSKLGLIINLVNNQFLSNGRTELNFLTAENQTDSTANSTLIIPKKINTDNFCFYFDKYLDTNGRHLYLDITNLLFTNDTRNDIENRTYDPYSPLTSGLNKFRSTGNQFTNALTFNLIVDQPTKHLLLSYGTRLTYTTNKLDSRYFNFINSDYQLNVMNSNKFSYEEGIQALFMEGSKSLKKWDLKAGIRGEMIEVSARSSSVESKIKYNYFQLFPTFYANYQINANNNINLNYGRRINRPNYTQFNPFRLYTSKYVYNQGNPNLKPSYNHNLELSYTYKFKFITTLYTSFEQNGFGSIPLFTNESNIQIYSDENYFNSTQSGITQLFIFDQIKRFESVNQVSFYYAENKSLIDIYPNIKGYGAYIYSGNSCALDKKKNFNLYLNILYQFPSVNGIYRSKNIASFDLGVKMNFFRNRIQTSISAFDIFKTNINNATILLNGVTTKARSYFDARQIRVSLSYRFGNEKMKLTKKELLNTEENNRVK